MQKTIENPLLSGRVDRSSGGVMAEEGLSELIIPAVPGEFYAYPAKFTKDKPLYVLMKCKSNKARSIVDAKILGCEANLLFLFSNPIHMQICSVKVAHTFGLLGDSINDESFGETWVAPTQITLEDFYEICAQKDVATLVELCQSACSEKKASVTLESGMVVAIMTDGGKYGLFLIKELTPALIKIDACHILV